MGCLKAFFFFLISQWEVLLRLCTKVLRALKELCKQRQAGLASFRNCLGTTPQGEPAGQGETWYEDGTGMRGTPW